LTLPALVSDKSLTQGHNHNNTLDTLLPHSEAAEQGLLGAILLAPDTLFICRRRMTAGKDYFYDLKHQVIYDACLAVDDAGKPVDLISVSEHLRSVNQLREVGGMSYLSDLHDRCPSIANAEYHLSIVIDKWTLRQIAHRGTQLAQAAIDWSDDPKALVAHAGRVIGDIGASLSAGALITNSKAAVGIAADRFQAEWDAGGEITGVKTGWSKVDRLLWGLQPGWMNVVAARPGMGKTAVMCNVAEHAAVENKVPTLVFSYEMTADRLVSRMACSRAGVDARAVREKRLTEGQYQALCSALLEVAKSPLYIVDSRNATSDTLQSTIEQGKKLHGIQLVCFDYLQKIPCKPGLGTTFTDQVRTVSIDTFEAIRNAQVASIVLAQINRAGAKNKDGRPTMEDLKDSGQIEQDADTVMLLHRDPKQDLEDSVWRYQFYLDKNRDGDVGMFRMSYQKRITKFIERDDFD
jgi:replicative DNA helicase